MAVHVKLLESGGDGYSGIRRKVVSMEFALSLINLQENRAGKARFVCVRQVVAIGRVSPLPLATTSLLQGTPTVVPWTRQPNLLNPSALMSRLRFSRTQETSRICYYLLAKERRTTVLYLGNQHTELIFRYFNDIIMLMTIKSKTYFIGIPFPTRKTSKGEVFPVIQKLDVLPGYLEIINRGTITVIDDNTVEVTIKGDTAESFKVIGNKLIKELKLETKTRS
jgi:hypothetical protein